MNALPSMFLLALLTVAFAGCTEPEATATEGKQLSGTANEVDAGKSPPTGALLRSDKQSFEGTIAVGTQDPASGMTGCGDVGQDGVDQMTFDWVVVDKEADGSASVARKAVIKLTGTTPTTMDIDLFVIGPGGAEVASATSGDPAETLEIATPLKAGNYQLLVTACNVAAIQFTLDAVADYYAA